MKRKKGGSTIKQVAYATRMMNGNASSKKEAALLSGFSLAVAENAKYKIESTEGYKNALLNMFTRSNNLLNAAMIEFELRGFSEFSNKDMVSALNAITAAWEKIDTKRAPNKMKTPEGNPLRAIFTERTRTAVIEPIPQPALSKGAASAKEESVTDAEFVEDDPDDF